MGWADAADAVAAALLVTGCLLSLLAAVGMVRLPDLLSRMHAATKPQVLGLALLLLGVALRLRDVRSLGLLAMVLLFQLATTPIASHMVGRAAFRAGQVHREMLVVDDLSDVIDGQEEPRGAP
jgi:multicomponent Na+:H+ antiporter subunit G